MKEKKKRSFLINRMRRLFLFAVSGIAISLAYFVSQCLKWKAPLWPVALMIVVALGWMFAWWRLVVQPMCRRKTEINQLLHGYGDPRERRIVPVDPTDELLQQQVKTWLDPSKAFQLNKRQAQYLALQNQINPHFLYNTLESIRSEALLAGLSSVADMTEALANFFRYTISKDENLVTVEEELQNCETYFHIQQYRFGDRLELKIDCAEEDRDEIYRCLLPKLTLQPILENSIIHGTELKVGTGHLSIHMSKTEKRLLLQASDDGLGMDEETLARLNSRLGRGGLQAQMSGTSRTGVALVNVDNRIRLLFGEEYGLHVYSWLGRGTTVDILLPIITSDHDVPNREVLG